MMKEEDDIDLTLKSLSSEMSDISLTGTMISLSEVSSTKSSKASSVIGEMTGKLEEEDLLDDLGSFKSSTSTPNHSVNSTQFTMNNIESETVPEIDKLKLQNAMTTSNSLKNLFGNDNVSENSDNFGNLLFEKESASSFYTNTDKLISENHKKDSNIKMTYNNSNEIIQPSASRAVISDILTSHTISPNHLHSPMPNDVVCDNSQLKETTYFHVSEFQQNNSQTQILTNNSSTFASMSNPTNFSCTGPMSSVSALGSHQAILSYSGPISSTSVQDSSFTHQQFHNQEVSIGQPNNQCFNQEYHQQQSQPNQPYIPSMYSSEECQNPSIFIPSIPKDAPNNGQYKTYSPTYNINNSVTPTNQYNSPVNNEFTSYPAQNNSWQIEGIQKQKPGEDDEPGIWDWVKHNLNTDWTEGAQKLGKQILEKTKTATDTVLTTLDPGMEEYLKPVVNIGVSSQNYGIIQGIRHGFRGIFGHAAAKGQHTVHSHAPLPIGFEAGVNATVEMLNYLSTVNFEFNGSYILVATEVFLTELQQGRWSAMFCLGLRDVHRNIELHSFSQPIPLPLECVTIAYQRTAPEQVEKMSGYGISIEEAVRLYKPYTEERDWCFAIAGISRQTVLTLASQCLAADYKRQMESGSGRLNRVESLVIM